MTDEPSRRPATRPDKVKVMGPRSGKRGRPPASGQPRSADSAGLKA